VTLPRPLPEHPVPEQAVPEQPAAAEAHSLDDLVSDCAEVTRHLAEVPTPRRTLTIPDRAVRIVAGLDTYGD
jgi:hypothetical protein